MVRNPRATLSGTRVVSRRIALYNSCDTLRYMSNRRSRSFRFDPAILEQLDRRARAASVTLTALVERYVREGLHNDEHPDIVFRDGPAGRRAAIAGGLDVWEVVSTVRANDGSSSEAAAYLAVPERHVVAAMRYYADYPYEIDARLAEHDRMYEEELRRVRRVADAF